MKVQTEYGLGKILHKAQGYTFVWLDTPVDRFKDGSLHHYVAISDNKLEEGSSKQDPFQRLTDEYNALTRK